MSVRKALDFARDVFPRLDPGSAGKLFLDADGIPTWDLEAIIGRDVRVVDVRKSGSLISFEGVDRGFLQGTTAEFGENGSRIPEPPAP